MTATNPLHWLGSKRTLAPKLWNMVKAALGPGTAIYEPFVGAGHFSLYAMAQGHRGPLIWSDNDALLIRFYITLQGMQPRDFAELEQFWYRMNKNRTLLIRKLGTARYGVCDMEGIEFVGSYYLLNQCAHSGLMRFNKSGIFNTPLVRLQNVRTEKIRALAAFALGPLRSVCVQDAMDATRVVWCVGAAPSMYFVDPPYRGTWNYNGQWGEQHTIRLHKILADLCHAHVPVLYTDAESVLDMESAAVLGKYGHWSVLPHHSNHNRARINHSVFVANL